MSKSTKILLAAVAAILVAGLVIMFTSKKSEPVVAEPTFDEYVMNDFEYAKSFENDSTTVRFYEVETVLNGNIDTLTYDELKVVSSMTAFAVNDTVFMLTRTYETGELVEEKVLGHWEGTASIDSVNFPVTFDKAVELLYSTNYPLPAGDKMTFRKPLDGRSENPYYIFGTVGTHFVFVDAVTGEVKVEGLEDVE